MSEEKKESLIEPEIEQMQTEESPKEKEFREGKKKIYFKRNKFSNIMYNTHMWFFFNMDNRKFCSLLNIISSSF